MGNNLHKTASKTTRKSPSFNCFNSKLTNKKQLKQSFSYDSSTKLNLLSKVKNRIKNGPFTNNHRVPKSKTDENFLVIEELQTESNLEPIDEIYENYEQEMHENISNNPFRKMKKSPALDNIQSIGNEDIKISDLISNPESGSYEQDLENSSETSFSNSTLTLDTSSSINPSEVSVKLEQISQSFNRESNRFSANLIKQLIIKSLRCHRPKQLTQEESCENSSQGCTELEVENQSEQMEDGLKFIDESMSCILKVTSSSSISLSNSYTASKSQTNLESSNLSFRLLNDVNRKLNRIQYLKKKRTLKSLNLSYCTIRDSVASERENLLNHNTGYLHELNNTRFDFTDNVSVYTLFNKQAPFASSENTTISASNDYLEDRNYFLNSIPNLNSISLFNSIANLNNF